MVAVHDRKALQLWDVATRKLVAERDLSAELIAPNDPHYAVGFAPDGRSVVLETKRGQLERWETRFLNPLKQLHAPWAMYVRGVHWMNDGQTILGVADNGLVHFWDAKTGNLAPSDGYNGRLRFAVTADGSRIVVGDHARRIDVWDVATGRVVQSLDKGHDLGEALLCLTVSPDRRRVLAGDYGGCIRVFRLDGGEDAPLIPEDLNRTAPGFHFLVWAPDGKTVFTGDYKTLRRLKASDGKPVWECPAGDGPCALSPDGQHLVTTQKDKIVFLDATTGKTLATVRVSMTPQQAERNNPLRAIAFAPDGRQLALVVGQNEVAVVDRAGRELRRFPATDRKNWPARMAFAIQQQMPDQLCHRVEALTFTPDGKWIVSGAEDTSVKVWEAATGKLVVRFDGHDSTIEQVATAPDGRSVFSASRDGFVGQWEVTAKLTRPAKQTPEELWAAAAGPDPAPAVAAAWALLTRSNETRAFVGEKLPSSDTKVTDVQLARLLKDLDAPAFTDREAASKALAALGRTAERGLRETIRTSPSLEARRRAEELLTRFENRYSADELRALRMVQACERSDAPDARVLLRRWAGGSPGALLTEDAKAALARLDRRP
jgi:WD40 repeat protein